MPVRKLRIPSFGSQLMMEILLIVLIIMTTVTVITASVPEMKKKATILTAGSEAISLWRTYSSAFYAMNGYWPEQKEDMIGFLIADSPQIIGKFVEPFGSGEHQTMSKSITFNHGAMDVELPAPLEGEIITVRPAQPYGDASGPVAWFMGPHTPEGWEPVGPDHSTVKLYETK